MPHVSKRKLHTKTRRTISGNLVGLLVGLRGAQGRRFLGELLTPTEQIMLAKRLALIAMLTEGYSYYRIEQTLKMSTSTIKRVHIQLDTHTFRTIQTMLAQKKSRENFWHMVEKFSRGGLPPKGARWKRDR